MIVHGGFIVNKRLGSKNPQPQRSAKMASAVQELEKGEKQAGERPECLSFYSQLLIRPDGHTEARQLLNGDYHNEW